MNSSNKTDKQKPEELREESMAIFVAGQVMGLMGQLNVKALQRFYKSPRSDPKQGSDFRYRNQIAETIKFHKALFRGRK